MARVRESSHTIELRVPSGIAELLPARKALEQLGETYELASRSVSHLQVILDELFSNVVRHGGTDGPVSICICLRGDVCTMKLTDTGKAFDPTLPAFPNEAERPRIGGRGLNLVAALADSFDYERRDTHNWTRVTKTVTFDPERGHDMYEGLTLEEDRADGSICIALGGRIDSGNAPRLTEHLTGLVAAGHKDLVIDFAGLDYLTSAGFRALLIVSDAAEAKGGELTLTNLTGQVKELFDLSGLTQAFRVV